MDFSGISDKSLLGRTLRAPLRLVPSRARVPVLQGRLRGKWWIVGSSTHGCWLGSYEWQKQCRFAGEVRPGWVIYDIGAHVGFYTLLSSVLVGPTGRVFAYEPAPRNLFFLREHVRINHCSNVTIIDSAVGEHAGVVAFDQGPSSSMGQLHPDGDLRVRVDRLDDAFRAGTPVPDLIKMDIEGGEYLALLGARELLASARPKILLATHGPDVHERCVSFLTSIGYQIEVLGPPDELMCTREM